MADEQLFAEHLPTQARKVSGIYFTPRPLVTAILERVRAGGGEDVAAIVDPATGAGAFLAEAERLFPGVELRGLELHPEIARACRARLPRARIFEGNALEEGFDRALLDVRGAVLFVGNPPYNGTSPLLANVARREALQCQVGPLPPGTSLRDDYAFFMLLAANALERHRGWLAFVTPVSLLDAFLYAPLRRYLLERLELVEVWELGREVFRGTQVRTCVTFWRAPPGTQRAARYRVRDARGPFSADQLGPPLPLEPVAPDWLLRPIPPDAAALDAQWRANGEPLSTLVPVSFPGLKTRFDELLTDTDADRLYARVDAFLKATDVEAFAATFGIEAKLLPKLEALKTSLPSSLRASRDNVRRFFRYRGARHRGSIPRTAWEWCYLDRALIPRGDHRLRGKYDPHRGDFKLVFNVRELPLASAVVEHDGCVHDHRHARFAPLFVPQRVRDEGLAVAASKGEGGPLVPNLSERGRRLASELGGERMLFRAICAFLNSEPFQNVWAPAFGTLREPVIPFDALRGR